MRYLLDTHSLLWSLFSPEKLSAWARKEIGDPGNEVAVSVVTFWEISLKYALGKLGLVHMGSEELPQATEEMGLEILPLRSDEAASFHKLPRLAHKDPFDRIIIAQAILEGMPLLTKDSNMPKYGIQIIW